MDKIKREKFTTTLKPQSKKNLSILTAAYGFKYINEFMEDRIEKEWKRYKNAMDKK